MLTRTAILVLCCVAVAVGEQCTFEFDDPLDLNHFDQSCSSSEDVWSVISLPTHVPQPYEPTNGVLSVRFNQNGCLRTYNELTLSENTTVEVAYYQISGLEQRLSFNMEIGGVRWLLVDGTVNPDGGWFYASKTFQLQSGGNYPLTINAYRGAGTELYISYIRVNDLVSGSWQCYVTTTPEPTTTTTEPTTTTTEEPTTTTTEPTTTTTEEPTTTTTEPTTTTTEEPTTLPVSSTTPYENRTECGYSFESPDELYDFDLHCDGIKGRWSIIQLPPNVTTPSEGGTGVLIGTNEIQECLQLYRPVKLDVETTFEVMYYQKNLVSNYISFKMSVEGFKWQVIDGEPEPLGKWITKSYTFHLPATDYYRVRIEAYRNFGELYINYIRISNVVGSPDQCYATPRPGQSLDVDSY